MTYRERINERKKVAFKIYQISKPLPKKHYVYVLINNNRIVYIGYTNNIFGRLDAHLKSEKKFNYYSIINKFETKEKALEKEKYYIKLFRPIYNINYIDRANKSRNKRKIKLLNER
jgi:predicted GIY-YIG superfamily endonuclease|tara:strand:+ start:342 stop:689 length:348 start_codon:yes stop_codon:yes gene_type:complete